MGVGWNQGFAFDKHDLSMIHREISRSDEQKSISQWKDDLPMGPNAVEGNISYLKHSRVYDTKERKLTPLGNVIVENDPGWRDKGTIYLLYFNISTNTEATAWHYMANVFIPRNKSFSKKEAEKAIKRQVAGQSVSKENAVEDIGFFLRSVSEPKAFGDIRVVQKNEAADGDIYIRRSVKDIPRLILAYFLYRQREDLLSGDNSVKIERLLNQEKSFGKAFNLYESEGEFLKMVDDLEQRNIASFTQTADLNDLEFMDDSSTPISFISRYYSEN
ncbi:hypothetical protein GGQ05_000837 [Salinibacter ruber]|uniref:DUF4007 family protein n=1 Tax=Salinibacter ruber TaxID=146919 RepID=UPI0021680F44|nr:DUF4007 family protein [Salinibacter ruber]MCS4169393.1 hypothetical protein [Salinibacter ruber]